MTSPPPTAPLPADRRALFVILLLLALSLLPIWMLDYLPMQDYPQHLFQAKLTSEWLSGTLNSQYYQVHLKPTYSIVYLLLWLLQLCIPPDDAGRAAVSLYLFLVAWAAWRTILFSRRHGGSGWGALFLFPAAFNQIYFLGLLNFLYAVPVLWLIALNLLERSRQPWMTRGLIFYSAGSILLLFIHPFAVAMEMILVTAWLLATWRQAAARRFFLVALGISALLAAIWFATGLFFSHGAPLSGQMNFQSPWKNALFMLYLFTGMRGPAHPDLFTVATWGVAILLLGWSAFRSPALPDKQTVRLVIAAALALIFVILFFPFYANNVGYLNVRIVFALYIALATLAALMPLQRYLAVIVLVMIVCLQGRSWASQYAISREIAEMKPLVLAIPPGAAILPLVFDRDSPEADGYYFSPHLNDYFYYHLARGGVSPYLWYAPAEGNTPISFKPGMQPPAPEEYFPTQFRWEQFGQPYQYFLVRGGSPSLYRYMERESTLRVTSGKWRLYERNPASSQAASHPVP